MSKSIGPTPRSRFGEEAGAGRACGLPPLPARLVGYRMTTTWSVRVSQAGLCWMVNVTVPALTKVHVRTAASYRQDSRFPGVAVKPSGPRFSTRSTAPILRHSARHSGPPPAASMRYGAVAVHAGDGFGGDAAGATTKVKGRAPCELVTVNLTVPVWIRRHSWTPAS